MYGIAAIWYFYEHTSGVLQFVADGVMPRGPNYLKQTENGEFS